MTDLISRKAAIDVVHHTIYEFFDAVEDDDESPLAYKDVKLLELNKSISTRIKDLPSAQRWIPVSERLPQPNEEDADGFVKAYLVQDGRWMDVARWNGDWWVAYGYGTALPNVTAWMPLPKPYKEDE